jgi:hypothetical protein
MPQDPRIFRSDWHVRQDVALGPVNVALGDRVEIRRARFQDREIGMQGVVERRRGFNTLWVRLDNGRLVGVDIADLRFLNH